MSKISEQAIDAAPGDESFVRATTATHEVLAIPASMHDAFCTFHAVTTAVHIRFGTSSSVEVDPGTVSAKDGSGVLTEQGTEPHIVVPAGGSVDRRIPAKWTHFAHESADANGLLIFGCSTGTGTQDDG